MPETNPDKTSMPPVAIDLRDWFAGQALAGFCAGLTANDNIEALPALCYDMADAMLKERTK